MASFPMREGNLDISIHTGINGQVETEVIHPQVKEGQGIRGKTGKERRQGRIPPTGLEEAWSA